MTMSVQITFSLNKLKTQIICLIIKLVQHLKICVPKAVKLKKCVSKSALFTALYVSKLHVEDYSAGLVLVVILL